jgi:hydroxymethylpyrimidine pyrophosphatase-like HAD family hydrolase/energy-coupling factor transporter ATP-binding protein EcfA2
MRYLALCCDYDGTLAFDGRLAESTIASLERLIASGRRLVMVTGRELPELQQVCPRLDLFEYVVAENGALLYQPATREEKILADTPPPAFVQALRARGVPRISVGRVIVATWEPHETTVLETIRDLGLELQVIFNKGAVMVLPAGVNKASGLRAALDAMGLSPHSAVGVGDAENDHAFLDLCECSVAVANALPLIKEKADLVTHGARGAGVEELIQQLLADDFASLEPKLRRHHILLGHDDEGAEVRIRPYGANVLLVGTSGSGKSTLATALLERLAEHRYAYSVIDPEGDYDEALPGAVPLGTPDRPPSADEIVKLLAKPGESAVVNLVGLPIADRPSFFVGLLPRLQELRARTGRPHWIVMDEAHHLLPAAWETAGLALPEKLYSVLQITVHPSLMATKALADVDTVIAVGSTPAAMLKEFAQTAGKDAPPEAANAIKLEPGQALIWNRGEGSAPFRLHIAPGRTERRRHTRKYAEGELEADRSFYFRGPQNRLNLRAQNLMLFLQLADGVDDDTWLHHLRNGDYSRWIREDIKDESLALAVRATERDPALSPAESRRRIREAVEKQYTLPASEHA